MLRHPLIAPPLKSKHAKGVTEAMIKLLEPSKEWVHTITFNNGKEFAFHETIAKKTCVEVGQTLSIVQWRCSIHD